MQLASRQHVIHVIRADKLPDDLLGDVATDVLAVVRGVLPLLLLVLLEDLETSSDVVVGRLIEVENETAIGGLLVGHELAEEGIVGSGAPHIQKQLSFFLVHPLGLVHVNAFYLLGLVAHMPLYYTSTPPAFRPF